MLCIINATSVLRAEGEDKHNLISVCTRKKNLQNLNFVFCSTPFQAFKNHSRGTLVIPEAGQSIPIVWIPMPNWPRWYRNIFMREKRETYPKYLSINSSKQHIRYEYCTGGTTNHQLPLFWFIFLSPLKSKGTTMVTVSRWGTMYLDNIVEDDLSTGRQKSFIMLGGKFIG